MRSREFITELKPRKTKTTTQLEPPEDPAWRALNDLKEQAHQKGQRMQSRLQLFMPRPSTTAQTRRLRTRRLHLRLGRGIHCRA